MMIYIEPLDKLITEKGTLMGERVRENFFGGFCGCGGIMYQKTWFQDGNGSILISECEKCWKNEALNFNGETPVGTKKEIRVIERAEFKEFLKEVLSNAEFEAVLAKSSGEEYNSNALSRAKKKLEELNLTLDEVLSHL